MLDFETLGNGEHKCLCQVGAIYFDSVTGELGESFKANIDAASHEAAGGKLDAATVYWWLRQSQAARESICAEPRLPVIEAMNSLNDFLAPAARVWSHSTFDFVLLQDTLRLLGIKPKVSYKKGLDLRTLVYVSRTTMDKTDRTGTHHDALEDCKHQVKYAVKALNAVRMSKKLLTFVDKLD